MMKPTTYLTAALLTATVVGLAGCGSSNTGSNNGAPPPAATSTSPAATSASPATTSASPATTSASPPTTSSSTPPAKQVAITIKDYGYSGPASVSPGATITVMNADAVNHTVTADTGGAFDVTVNAASSATFTAPTKPGSYPYHCIFHSSMHGTLVVK